MNALVPSHQIESIWFDNYEILVAYARGIPYVAMRPICEHLGLGWSSQLKRLNRDPILNSVMVMMTTTAADQKRYQTVFLPFEYLQGWLFTVDANRVKPGLKPRILKHQRECYRVLAEHFAAPERRARRQAEGALRQAESFWFDKFPHWRSIRDQYLLGLTVKYIAQQVKRSVSTVRRAVNRMMAMGLINPRQAALYRAKDGKQFDLWLNRNPNLGW